MKTALAPKTEITVRIHTPHSKQQEFIDSLAKRKIIRAGRRGGKTVGAAILAIQGLINKRRILYATPTQEQVETFWREVKWSLGELIDAGKLIKNETMHTIEFSGTEYRIRAKTAWNADTLRGDYADLLILDEWQLMSEDTWELVGAPMLLDNNGDVIFIYTPPSLHTRSVSKARDPLHAARMFKAAQADTTGRWQAFHFTSLDNPYISQIALKDITTDMSRLAYRQEILAQDIDEAPGALWTRQLLSQARVTTYPILSRVVVGVDPPGGVTEAGIVTAGLGSDGHGYILEDRSIQASPDVWAEAVLTAYHRNRADRIVGEANFGGDMVENTIMQAAKARGQTVSYKNVQASRGKAVRAEPVVAMFEQGRIHLVGEFPYLEDELCTWIPGDKHSPNRMDAMVWALTELIIIEQRSYAIEWA